MKRRKIIIITIIIIIILLVTLLSYFLLKKNSEKDSRQEEQEKVTLSFKELTLETGSEVPTIDDFIKNEKLNANFNITFELLDDSSKTLNTIAQDDKELIKGIGKYKVIIKNEDETYETSLTIIDEQAPILEVQDVKILEEDKIEVSNFIKSCIDNSHTDCFYKLLNSENKEIEIPSKVGEYFLKIVAIDESNNETKKEVKLTINEKKNTNTTKKTNNNTATKPNNNDKNNNNITTKPSTSSSSNTTNSNDNKKDEKPQEQQYIGVADPNNFNYSFHHGEIEYKSEEDCINDSYRIGYKNSKDIRNMWCSDVRDSENTILGYYLRINCISGNCNKYKNKEDSTNKN